MKVVITRTGEHPDRNLRIELKEDDATTQAIAQAVIELAQHGMSMSVGDSITVTEEK